MDMTAALLQSVGDIRVEPRPTCVLCGGHMSYRFSAPCDYRQPAERKQYQVYWCSACDYGSIWERPQAHEITRFYEVSDYYTHHAACQSASKEDQPSFFDRVRMHLSWRLDRGEEQSTEEVTDYLGSTARPTILEIGCGNGLNLVKFRDAGFHVTGVEPDAAALTTAREAIEEVLKGTAESLPGELQRRKFDVILMSHVLEHCLDINLTLMNTRGLLKDKGLLVLEVPNCRSMGFDLYREAWPWTDIPRHLNFFTPDSLKRACTRHGFAIQSTKYTGFFRQFSNSWLKTEENIWRILNDASAGAEAPNFRNRSWQLLFRSFCAPEERKYDSVRVLAAKQNDQQRTLSAIASSGNRT